MTGDPMTDVRPARAMADELFTGLRHSRGPRALSRGMRTLPRYFSLVVATLAVSLVTWGGAPAGSDPSSHPSAVQDPVSTVSAGTDPAADGYTGRTAFCVNWWVSAEANPELRRLQRGDRSVLTECIGETQADAVGSPSS